MVSFCFYWAGDEGSFHFDVADMARKGHDFKDYICPDGIEKYSDYLRLGDRYCRILFLKDYANYIQDEIVSDLTDLKRNMMLKFLIDHTPPILICISLNFASFWPRFFAER